MGEAGVLSRILCTLIGNAPFTYASLDKALAPGQLTAADEEIARQDYQRLQDITKL